jgi:hypothetical protein
MIVASLLTAIVYQAYAADPPSLKVSVKAEEDPIMRGNEQTISVTVTDTAGNPVAGASVMSHMITPSESTTKNFNGKTDENGKWSFSWQIDNQSKAGLVGVEVKASKTGFDDSFGSTFFKVIG